MTQIKWTARLSKATNYHLDNRVLQAEIGTEDFNREVSRIFAIARKRISSIEESGLYSPAVLSVQNDDFKMQGKSFFDLKMEYGRAIAFLKQPTSTLIGLKAYNRSIMDSYEIPEREFIEMSRRLNERIASFENNDYIEWFFMQYKNFAEEIEREAQGINNELESESERISREIDYEIEKELENSEQLKNDIKEVLLNSLRSLM